MKTAIYVRVSTEEQAKEGYSIRAQINIYSKGHVRERGKMKYNTLLDFSVWLEDGGLAPSTARTYFKVVDYLLKNQFITDCRKLDLDKVLEKLGSMKYKNQFSKYKSAFLKLCEFLNIALDAETRHKLDNMSKGKIKKRRRLKVVKLKSVNAKLRVIHDKRLKLSFEVLLNTGLRVFELAQIRKADCIITADSMELHFIGKGGKSETVSIHQSRNKRIFSDLLGLIARTKENEKVFYSASYLQTKALEKGFSCHDLRRAFAKLIYQEHKDLEAVKNLLRHTKVKNTQIYLRSKVEV